MMTKRKCSTVLQFKVDLLETGVWRRIQVPSTYSFWDLHVAIQDAMGWLDYHLHSFKFRYPRKRKDTEIGIPDPAFEIDIKPGWQTPVMSYFVEPGKSAAYLYDFGDSWHHEVLLEGILLAEPATTYPRCVDGERACPPEDCGGIPGYQELLEIVGDPKHAEYESHVSWLSNHAKNYWPYKPEAFDPDAVEFWDPKKRFRMAFS